MKTKFAALLCLLLVVVGVSPATAKERSLPIEQCKVLGNNVAGSEFRYEDAGHIEDWSKFLKPTGTLRMLVIPVDFPDVPATESAESELKFLSEVSDFFAQSSQGKLRLEIDSSMGWVRMTKTAGYYKTAFWAEKINDAIDLVDPIVDFSKYELVLFYVSKNNLITTEAGALPGFPDRKPDGLSQIRGVYLGNDFWRQKGHHSGVTIHETLHVFGLPDLYPVNKDGTKNVGVFDMMDGYTPKLGARLFYWNRWKLGWLNDAQVSCLNPRLKHSIRISNANAANTIWVFPVTKSLLYVLQPWVVNGKVSAISYWVKPKGFVWNSAGLSASEGSPIQMLRPLRAGKPSKEWENQNLQVVFQDRDTIRTPYLTFTVKKSGNNLLVSSTPR